MESLQSMIILTNFKKLMQYVCNNRSIIKQAYPEALKKISWGMPTFVYAGFNLVHFAKAKHHLGFYSADIGVSNFKDQLQDYACTKGSIHLVDHKEISVTLIQDIVCFRMKENEQYAQEKFEKQTKKRSDQKKSLLLSSIYNLFNSGEIFL